MNVFACLICLLACVFGSFVGEADQNSAPQSPLHLEQIDFFESQIRPILAENCYECHSVQNKKAKGGLTLDSPQGVLKGGDSGPILPVSAEDKSRLIEALRYEDDDLKMPPDWPLKREQVAQIEAWVKMGAPMPKPGQAAQPSSAGNHWSFQPLSSSSLPVVKNTGWPNNKLDHFVLARLEQEGLSPGPKAGKRILIRRATYDLTGLPPTPEEIEAFINDEAPDAFSKVIDRLLASPSYGERWGRHWLDIARYADTTGPRLGRIPFSYTYRDWVIQSFNEDLPYDQFVVKQLAADLLIGTDNSRDLAALGFLTVGRKSNRDTIHDIIDDWIDVVTRGFMGLSVNCARCHDHKFDPIPTREYYSLYGVFRNTEARHDLPVISNQSSNEMDARYEKQIAQQLENLINYRKKRIAEITAELRKPESIAAYLLATTNLRPNSEAVDKPLDTQEVEVNPFVLRRWKEFLGKKAAAGDPYWQPWLEIKALPSEKNTNEVVNLAKRYAAELSAADSLSHHADPKKELLRQALRGSEAPTELSIDHFAEVQNSGPDQGNTENILMLLNALGARYADAGGRPRAMAVRDSAVMKPAHVFVRGNPAALGEETPRHFLSLLEKGTPTDFQAGSGRLELARKIANANNPLTARVMVNRVWQHHFGNGLVRTSSDFGKRGEPPTHPELLDFLACQFMADGWSLKKLHRLIMLSNTYQQSSVDNPSFRNIDPENRLLWRANRQRADFESFRDSVLQVTGVLDSTVGGPPLPLFSQPSMRRRTVYGLIDRAQLPNALRAFDFANPEQHSPQRLLTTIPQQALFMMNDPFMAEHARLLATRKDVTMEQSSSKRLQLLYKIVLGREATDDEVQHGLKFIQEQNESSIENLSSAMCSWRFGFGRLNEAKSRLENFQLFAVYVAANQQLALLSSTFPVFTEVWQFGNKLPDPTAGFAHLTASGGEPGPPGYAVVRRWTAPMDGMVEITGSVTHNVSGELSEGITARVVSSRGGQLGFWKVAKTSAEANIKDIRVNKGDTIDCIVDAGAIPFGDEFIWAPTVKLVYQDKTGKPAELISPSAKEFKGPPPPQLDSWEQFALVLMQSNEFVFID